MSPIRSAALVMLMLSAGAAAHAQQVHAAPPDGAAIESLTGLKGTLIADENVFKVAQPRSDVKVSVEGRPLEPFMGLTSWAAFTPGSGSAAEVKIVMVMGDLVVFPDEVGPVMDSLFASGLSVTALHNHFFSADPSVYFMHIAGEGTTEAMAKGVRAALDAVRQVRAAQPQPAPSRAAADVPAASSIPADRVAEALGVKGSAKDGMFKAVIGRAVQVPCGCSVGKEMGVNTWVALAGSPERAIVDGDFVTLTGELQPVLHALRAAKINVVAIHNHMEGEKPGAIFLHYWSTGRAEDLARGVRSALDAQSNAATTAVP